MKQNLAYEDKKILSLQEKHHFKTPKEVVIEANHIAIMHQDLGLKIDVDTRQIEELHRIVINGVSFVREK